MGRYLEIARKRAQERTGEAAPPPASLSQKSAALGSGDEINERNEESPAPSTASRVRHLLATRGWVAIESGTLGGEVVLLLRDDTIQAPPRRAGHVAYTLAELAQVQGMSPAQLREVHEVKRIFDGWVAPPEGTEARDPVWVLEGGR